MNKIILIISGLVFAVVVGIVSHSSVAAQRSQLGQEITSGGICETNPSDITCSMVAPTIVEVNDNDGRPIVKGTYDRLRTSTLKILVAGVVYTLGIDAELTAVGNEWVLDLSGIAVPLVSGEYTIVVEAIDNNDQSQVVERVFEVSTTPPGGSQNGSVWQAVDDMLSETGQSIKHLALGGFVLVIIAVTILLGARRKKNTR